MRRSDRGVIAGCVAVVAVVGAREARAQPITGGTPSAADPAVVALVERAPQCSAGPTLLCTGTLIAPRAVLTAAHCVWHTPPSSLAVVAAADFTGGAPIDIIDVIVHPGYPGGNDIAVVALAEPLPGDPLPIRRAPMDSSHVEREVRIVGFGIDDGGDAGVKRTGTAVIAEINDDTFVIEPGPAMSCGGDSGGPVLLAEASDPEQVAGVTAFGDPACAVSGTNTRVDVHAASFIDPALADIAAMPSPSPRPPIDTEIDYCAEPCVSPVDCPAATECVNGRCALFGVEVGRFDRGCESCGAGACLAGLVEDTCVCFTACEPPSADCGCRSTTADPSWLAIAVAWWLAARRRRLTETRCVGGPAARRRRS